jgi:hypothetical protein
MSAAMLCVTAAALSGCADNYPRLPDLSKMTNILTPKERDEAIKELTSDTSKSTADAAAARMPEGQK